MKKMLYYKKSLLALHNVSAQPKWLCFTLCNISKEGVLHLN